MALGSLGEQEFSKLGEDGATLMDASVEEDHNADLDDGGSIMSSRKGKRVGKCDFDIVGSS